MDSGLSSQDDAKSTSKINRGVCSSKVENEGKKT